jgi:hypothetical protein
MDMDMAAADGTLEGLGMPAEDVWIDGVRGTQRCMRRWCPSYFGVHVAFYLKVFSVYLPLTDLTRLGCIVCRINVNIDQSAKFSCKPCFRLGPDVVMSVSTSASTAKFW